VVVELDVVELAGVALAEPAAAGAGELGFAVESDLVLSPDESDELEPVSVLDFAADDFEDDVRLSVL
jgi:hypothetical protein